MLFISAAEDVYGFVQPNMLFDVLLPRYLHSSKLEVNVAVNLGIANT